MKTIIFDIPYRGYMRKYVEVPNETSTSAVIKSINDQSCDYEIEDIDAGVTWSGKARLDGVEYD